MKLSTKRLLLGLLCGLLCAPMASSAYTSVAARRAAHAAKRGLSSATREAARPRTPQQIRKGAPKRTPGPKRSETKAEAPAPVVPPVAQGPNALPIRQPNALVMRPSSNVPATTRELSEQAGGKRAIGRPEIEGTVEFPGEYVEMKKGPGGEYYHASRGGYYGPGLAAVGAAAAAGTGAYYLYNRENRQAEQPQKPLYRNQPVLEQSPKEPVPGTPTLAEPAPGADMGATTAPGMTATEYKVADYTGGLNTVEDLKAKRAELQKLLDAQQGQAGYMYGVERDISERLSHSNECRLKSCYVSPAERKKLEEALEPTRADYEWRRSNVQELKNQIASLDNSIRRLELISKGIDPLTPQWKVSLKNARTSLGDTGSTIRERWKQWNNPAVAAEIVEKEKQATKRAAASPAATVEEEVALLKEKAELEAREAMFDEEQSRATSAGTPEEEQFEAEAAASQKQAALEQQQAAWNKALVEFLVARYSKKEGRPVSPPAARQMADVEYNARAERILNKLGPEYLKDIRKALAQESGNPKITLQQARKEVKQIIVQQLQAEEMMQPEISSKDLDKMYVENYRFLKAEAQRVAPAYTEPTAPIEQPASGAATKAQAVMGE